MTNPPPPPPSPYGESNPPGASPQKGPSNGMAVAALVLGILTFVCLGPIAGVLAIIFGFVGLSRAKEVGVGKGMSIAGIVLGIVGSVAAVLIAVLFIFAADEAVDDIATVPEVSVTTADGSSEGGSATTEDSSETEASGSAVACKDATPDQNLDTQRVGLYPGRLDTQPDNDHEAVVGDCVRVAGRTGYVLGVEEVTDFAGDPILRVTVRVENRDDEAHPYNPFNWRLQTPGGQVIDGFSAFDTDAPNPLRSGDLVPGGTVEGSVSYELPADAGAYYIIWKPDAFNADRGIWQVTR